MHISAHGLIPTPIQRLKLKDLQESVSKLQSELVESEANRILVETSLAQANETIQEKETALAEALARIQGLGNANADSNEAPLIERPRPSTKGGRIPIQQAMGLDGQDELYGNIQKYIHTLVAACGIDWKLDFRLQSPDNLSKVYRAARKEYPILKRFKNDWATEFSGACSHPWLSPSRWSKGILAFSHGKLEGPGQREHRAARSPSQCQWQPPSSSWSLCVKTLEACVGAAPRHRRSYAPQRELRLHLYLFC
ncbi:hypothetical protein GSI_08430 [Ganoderma sinense ZZ0214-1]|uniref:Uncharacterized protein n=1 Tax=Ganoderma sinense ZZ0214-1 TaxID=1077348 RepID=A0A2G8S7G1_9APHY|nr:hypothetical protein GSI_08430 [Ganoderma sinense ZZ0214-1]